MQNLSETKSTSQGKSSPDLSYRLHAFRTESVYADISLAAKRLQDLVAQIEDVQIRLLRQNEVILQHYSKILAVYADRLLTAIMLIEAERTSRPVEPASDTGAKNGRPL